jgi:hypothetical protein
MLMAIPSGRMGHLGNAQQRARRHVLMAIPSGRMGHLGNAQQRARRHVLMAIPSGRMGRMSTRALIVAALLCGLAILIAGTVNLLNMR